METFTLKRGERTYKVTAPDRATAEAELDAHRAEMQQPKVEEVEMGVGEDVARSAGAGLARGAAMIPGLPGDLQSLWAHGVDWAAKKMTGKSPGVAQLSEDYRQPTSNELVTALEERTGELHEPKTRAGKFARTIGEFAPAAVGGLPGLGRRFIGRAAIPGAASEGAGQVAEAYAPEYGPYARLAGALTGLPAGSRVESAMRSAVPGMSRRASGIMREGVNAPDAWRRMRELGPEAMLLDASPSTLGTAQGVVTKPGRGRDALVEALEQRQSGREGRLLADADQHLGPVATPSYVDQNLQVQQRSLGPSYTAVKESASPVDLTRLTLEINNAIPMLRGAPQRALQNVKRMIDGDVISAQEAHNIRQALDDVINSGNIGNFERRLLTDARTMVDNQLAKSAPGIKDLDATYQQLAREREALAEGPSILDSGKTAQRPEELADMLRNYSTPERAAYRTGARAEVDRIQRTTANDLTALRRIVKGEGDWNRAKLAEVFGEEAADNIIGSVDREAAFQDAYNKIVQNSQTAQRQQASKMIDASDTPQAANIPPIWERLGAAPEAAARFGARAMQRGIEATRSDKLREELAEVLTRRGRHAESTANQILLNAAQNGDDAALIASLIALRASQPPHGVSP